METIKSLQKTIKRAKRSSFYKKKLSKTPLPKNLDDFRKIPFTTKDDLRRLNSPYDILACDESKVVQLNTTSGTTGEPVFSLFTKNDLIEGSQGIGKAWKSFGVSSESRVQFIMSYGLFSGASLNTLALQDIGAFVIPSGIQSLDKQLKLIKKFKPDTLVATPSFFLYLYQKLKKEDMLNFLQKFKVCRGIAAGEVYSDYLRNFIEEGLGIKIIDHYGICEVYSGFAYECKCRNGLHVLDSIVFTEIVDVETGEVIINNNKEGELVVTSIHKEATPVIRYRTGDITCKKEVKNNCYCEVSKNSSSMIGRIKRRKDDIIFIKGVKIDPYFVRDFLIDRFNEYIKPNMNIVVNGSPTFKSPDIYLDFKKHVSDKFIKKISNTIKKETSINFNIIKKNKFSNVGEKSKLVIYR